MGDLSRLKGTQSNTLCSGFGSKNPLMGFFKFFFPVVPMQEKIQNVSSLKIL